MIAINYRINSRKCPRRIAKEILERLCVFCLHLLGTKYTVNIGFKHSLECVQFSKFINSLALLVKLHIQQNQNIVSEVSCFEKGIMTDRPAALTLRVHDFRAYFFSLNGCILQSIPFLCNYKPLVFFCLLIPKMGNGNKIINNSLKKVALCSV